MTSFFLKIWEQTKHAVIHTCHTAFNTSTIPKIIKSTFVTLIPKVPRLENINQYRPINLRNTIYKIITKIIVHRMRHLLPNLINPTQSSFIPGHRAVINAIFVQELIHSFHRQKGQTENMMIKIDLEKAFDRLE